MIRYLNAEWCINFAIVILLVGKETSAQPSAARKVFSDSVAVLPAEDSPTPHVLTVRPASAEHREETMNLLFSLSLSEEQQKELESIVEKGEVISAETRKARFSPKEEDVKKLKEWLKKEHFEIIDKDSKADPTTIYARAKVTQIESSLQVQMVRVTREGQTFTSAKNAPSLPTDVGDPVRAIIGLQPFRSARKRREFITLKKKRAALMGSSVVASPSAVPAASSVASPNQPPYLVPEILKAYNGNSLGLTGKGQQIAILIDTLPDDSDLKQFWALNGISPQPNVIPINVLGTNLPPREGEETLDVEWASGIAPGATIRIYASGSLQFVDLDQTLDSIMTDAASVPGLRQLSISLGLGETFMGAGAIGAPPGEVSVQHKKYLLLNAAGVNVFIASGDAGSTPDSTGHNTGGPLQVEYGASDTAATAVGGTALLLNSNGTVNSEVGWVGSGGGKSLFFSRPIWQGAAGFPAGNSRLVPDVSLAADENTGALVVLQGQQVQIGGTSWSTPVWAGFCALINESRVKAGKKELGFINPHLYKLMGKPAFRDIVSGSNGPAGNYDAGVGYDLVTGIGVPNVKELVNALTLVP